jgi:ABC-type cobalamin/Fe3+-siderophores transport system ATPase subunit
MNRDITIIQATHLADHPERLGSEVIAMENGRLV